MLKGLVVTHVREMSRDELQAEGWEVPLFGTPPLVIEFTNGTRVYASRDSEGSGPGALFGVDRSGAFQLGAEPVIVA